MTKTVGLTLGKFAPLHAGHQFVIETALAEMDQVIVVIYDCPEITSVPLPVRAQWIQQLYPQVQVLEAWDGPTEVGNTPEIKRRQEDYLCTLLDGRRVSHFYSSEFYGEHISQSLGAIDRRVDATRMRYPVSGTAIRRHPYTYRQFLSPVVYRDLVSNIVLLGAPSTGKTTLAERLAQAYHTVWMPEYGREYWEQHQIDRRLAPHQLVEIAEQHVVREERCLYAANQYLFTDTNALTTYQFALAYHGAVLPRLAELANQAAARYDVVLLCDTDIPYADTWDRSGDVQQQTFQKRIVSDLLMRNIPFFVVRGDLDARVRYVQALLGRFRKYTNFVAALFHQTQTLAPFGSDERSS